MTYIERFVLAMAEQNAKTIRVERHDTVARITLGTRHVDVSLSDLIVIEDALRTISAAVDELFGIVRTPSEGVSRET